MLGNDTMLCLMVPATGARPLSECHQHLLEILGLQMSPAG